MKKFYYLYQIRNLVNDKIYIGVHQTTDLADGYMGSGVLLRTAIGKYGEENFEKIILKYFDSAEEMFHEEAEIVSQSFVKRSDTYNISEGGKGGHGPNARRSWLLENDPEWRAAYSKKLSESVPKPTAEHQRQVAETNRRNKTGACFNPEIRAEMNRRSWSSPEARQRRAETRQRNCFQQGENNSMYGKVWVYSEEQQKSFRIPQEQLPEYIAQGYRKGRRMKWGTQK
jgi:hypothetical protein